MLDNILCAYFCTCACATSAKHWKDLQSRLNLTSVSVQAISGIGLTQNAQAKQPWQLGKLTLPDFFNRTLQVNQLPACLFVCFRSLPVFDTLVMKKQTCFFPVSQSDPKAGAWNFSAEPSPLFVYLSVGGNDFNHQHNAVPTNATFTAAYKAFLLRIFAAYGNATTVVNVCGQGSPVEAKFDPGVWAVLSLDCEPSLC